MSCKRLVAADLLDRAGGKAASEHVLLLNAGARGTNMAVLRGKRACANGWWAAEECTEV